MSSVAPSTGDDAHRNKTCNTNNSASQDLVTPLTTKRKGKGVSRTEEPDPEADSPVNVSRMPPSGPVLTGPHTPDTTNQEEAALSPAAPQSAKRMPTASRSASAQPTAPKSARNSKTTKSNKTVRKASTSNTNQPSSSKQQLSNEQNDSTQALREDLLNLRASKSNRREEGPEHSSSSYVSHTATLHIRSIKTLDTANQFPYTNVWEGLRQNVNQFLQVHQSLPSIHVWQQIC